MTYFLICLKFISTRPHLALIVSCSDSSLTSKQREFDEMSKDNESLRKSLNTLEQKW